MDGNSSELYKLLHNERLNNIYVTCAVCDIEQGSRDGCIDPDTSLLYHTLFLNMKNLQTLSGQ